MLVVVVLFAQWMGLRHRIEHAEPISAQHLVLAADQSSSDTSTEYSSDTLHSCALFDGMTLADGAPALPFLPLLQTSVQVLALWAAYASWDAPVLLHFSSRAPPLA